MLLTRYTVKMKFLLALLLIAAAAQAASNFRTRYVPTTGKAHKLPSPRIINGEKATLGQYPYQVAINLDDKQFCGGALIAPNYVLTAAHCVIDIDTFVAVVGTQSLKVDPDSKQTITSRTAISHKDYDNKVLTNDIAIITLPSSFLYTKFVEPINLPSYSDAVANTYEGEYAIIAGWGSVVSGSDFINDELMYISPKVISVAECQESFGEETVKETNLCTSGDDSVGTCYGDSGSPVVLNITYGHVLIGISSFAPEDGCSLGLPSGHTRVGSYLEWINDNTGIFINA